MRRFWGPMSGALLATGIAAISVPGCAHNDSTLFVLDVLAPQLVAQGARCIYTSDPTQPYITAGTLDTALSEAYVAEFLVGNQMLAQASASVPRTETSIINIQGAYVTNRDTLGNFINSFTVFASATVQAASGTTPSFAPVGVELVNREAAKIAGTGTTIISSVRFFGKTLGGQSIESEEFRFPVDLCYGCLVYFSSSDINSKFQSPNCVGNGGQPPMTRPCAFGQDLPVDCVFCQGIPACTPPLIPVVTDSGTPPSDAGGGVPDAGSD